MARRAPELNAAVGFEVMYERTIQSRAARYCEGRSAIFENLRKALWCSPSIEASILVLANVYVRSSPPKKIYGQSLLDKQPRWDRALAGSRLVHTFRYVDEGRDAQWCCDPDVVLRTLSSQLVCIIHLSACCECLDEERWTSGRLREVDMEGVQDGRSPQAR